MTSSIDTVKICRLPLSFDLPSTIIKKHIKNLKTVSLNLNLLILVTATFEILDLLLHRSYSHIHIHILQDYIVSAFVVKW